MLWVWSGERRIVKEMLDDGDDSVCDGVGFGKEEGMNVIFGDVEIVEVWFHGICVVPWNVSCWVEEVLYFGSCLVKGIVKSLVECVDNGIRTVDVDGISKAL